MSTVQTIIDRAYRLLGQLNLGSSADVDLSANGLIGLNAMLGSWRNEKLMCYAIQDESIPLVATNTTRTIGPSGNLVSTRPVSILDASITYNNISIPVRVIEAEEWNAIPDKASTSDFPDTIYYRPEMPDGKIFLYPVPSASSTLHVLTQTPVLEFAAVSTAVSLPPGWEDALASNLAVHMAPECSVEPSPTVMGMAKNAKASIKRQNVRPLLAVSELTALTTRPVNHIISDS